MSANSNHPDVKRWCVTVIEMGKPGSFAPRRYDFPISNLPCSNKVCFNGGHDLAPFYDDFVKQHRKNNQPNGDDISCRGVEKITKRAVPRHVCLNTLNLKIEVDYHDTARRNV
jgi:hypothetical protein